MQELISTGLKLYAGKELKPGDRFEVADAGHVRTLTTSRLAKLATDEKDMTAGPAAGYQTRDLSAGNRGRSKITVKKPDEQQQ